MLMFIAGVFFGIFITIGFLIHLVSLPSVPKRKSRRD